MRYTKMMKKISQQRLSKYFKHPVLLLLILVMLITVCVLINWQHRTNAQVSLTSQTEASNTALKKLEAELEVIKAKKIAEEEAKKRAAAEATAIAATTATQEQAQSIDASTCRVSNKFANPAAIDVIINKKHCVQPLTYAPSDLVTINGATLSAKVIESFSGLYNAAAAAGQGFSVTSSYRSYNDQVSTYRYWVNTSGAAGADTYSARPGYSEHQTGFVMDIAAGSCVLDCFGTTSQYQWMQQHAADYGFIQRYYAGSEATTGYKAEEWHYRYVGKDIALDMKQKGIKTLEEYYGMAGGNY